MYKSIKLSVAFIFLAFFSAIAQDKKEFDDAVMNGLFEKFTKLQADLKAKKQYEADLEELVDRMCAGLQQWINQKKREQESIARNYKPGYNHKPGEMNLFPIWEEIPAPVPVLPEAKQTNFDLKYGSYLDKITLFKKQLSDQVQRSLGEQRSDQQSIIEDARSIANQNSIVQQMGGADAVMNMSEAERKKAAQRAVAQTMSNPGSFAPNQDAGMKVMMQRMMNDPRYREAYNKMSDAEKQAELKKYMGNAQTERNDAAFEQMLKDRNSTSNAIHIDQVLGKCLQQMQEAAKLYSDGTRLANDFYSGVYKDIENWYKRAYDALPLSTTREKMGLAALIKCRQTMLYAFQQKEAVTRTILWGLSKANTKIAFGEFNDLIGNYPWGKTKKASLVDAKYTESKCAQAVTSLYDEMIRMTNESERLTRIHKGQQEQFELIMK